MLGTYHDGTHVLPLVDADDTAAATTAADAAEAAKSGNGTSSSSGKGKATPTPRQNRHARSPLHRRLDVDDPGFVDTNVTVEFQFTGTAIYIYSLQPLGLPLVNTTPTAMNLTFNLDNKTHDTFLHKGSASATGYLPGVNIFNKTGLTETPHVLRVDVGPNSVFLFDYMVYTRSNASTTPVAQSLPAATSDTVSPGNKRHDIATFAGAVGGSVGVLSVIALGLAFSIIKRRRDYERRERISQRELRHNNSIAGQPVAGPAPFVPRFFPGTHVPADPPPYNESLPASSHSATSHLTPPAMVSSSVIPVTYSAHLALNQDRSYADVPPASPPPPMEDIIPPPPFGFVITRHDPGGRMDATHPYEGVVTADEAEEPRESDIGAPDSLLPVHSIQNQSQDSPS